MSVMVSTVAQQINTAHRLMNIMPRSSGNFHAMLLFYNAEEYRKAQAIVDRMVQRAIDLDGTCTPMVFCLSYRILTLCPRYRRTRCWRRKEGVP